ncbi:hypothetical protein [Bacteroides sp. 51]|uniref:hypothetical protein n=1 Tax=Bacteroides sp. 51 TaxID=2302938 RepID=UPI0013D03810|nr:hypothetical protein [Bacteroides sp. 51]NDV83913.1 hypothetical protein [Bacteroides sp. 51]
MKRDQWNSPPIRNLNEPKLEWGHPVWKIVFLILIFIFGFILVSELKKESSNFYFVFILSFVVSLFLFFTLKAFNLKIAFRYYWELFPLTAIAELVISIDNDVITQSDWQLENVLKRIYKKESRVDISQEFNKHIRPNLVSVFCEK